VDDVNEWNELEQKLDTALEHNTNELHQIAEIYKRLGMTEHAKEIETLMARQKKIVPIRIREAARQNRQAS
jgi:Zn-dependent oligopeptidase